MKLLKMFFSKHKKLSNEHLNLHVSQANVLFSKSQVINRIYKLFFVTVVVICPEAYFLKDLPKGKKEENRTSKALSFS